MTTETYWARIYIAGPIEVAKQLMRAECMRNGLCVTIDPTHFVYTGGEESGYVVGLVNYPRFPSTPEAIHERALFILNMLLDGTHQHSAMLMEPSKTTWVSRRES
jgi:hypothetical protein